MTDAITSNATALRVATIHERVSIFAVFERMGVDVTPETQQMRCPFHPDRTPSARVYADQNTLYCFTCQKGWDVIGCVTDHFRLPFLDALAWLEAEFALGDTLPSLSGRSASRSTIGPGRRCDSSRPIWRPGFWPSATGWATGGSHWRSWRST